VLLGLLSGLLLLLEWLNMSQSSPCHLHQLLLPGVDSLLDNIDELLDDADAAAQQRADPSTAAGRAALLARRLPAPQPKPQGAVHPGSTPAEAAAAGGRFLAYNQLGCVVSKAVDDHHVVEVSGTVRMSNNACLLEDFEDVAGAAGGLLKRSCGAKL
jgi:hypothetical protein